jgi:hypothetical protein
MTTKEKKELQKRVESVVKAGEYTGFCLDCGEEDFECEPDMEGGHCESCGGDRVYGAEQIFLIGVI